MNSKAIAQQFIENTPELTEKAITASVVSMINQFWKDFQAVHAARNCKTNAAFFALFKEMDVKWNAVRSRLYFHYGHHIIAVNGFREILKEHLPEVFEKYQDHIKS